MNLGKVSLVLLAAILIPAAAFAGVSGTVTVDYGTGEFEGYWCYTVDFTWDTPNSLSNISSFVGLEGLACACDPGIFVFPDPAGSSVGEEDGIVCELDYVGEYLCTGNPSLPEELSTATAVKWDPAPESCNAGTTGSGTVTFYSLLAPGDPEVHPDVLVIKASTGAIVGEITGQLPAPDCSVDHDHESLGQLKARF